MLRAFLAGLPLVPMLLSLIGGSIGSGVVTWSARSWWFDHVEKPAIEKAVRQEDAEIYEDAAKAAAAALALKNFKVIEQLTTDFYRQQSEDQAWHQAQVDQLNQEIADYEHGDTDAACQLTQPRLDFLGGVLAHAAPAHR